ncbi:MAG TPA: NTP transferase domain-containing protein [Rhizomicrobium sp.]|jgi:hypothetical protein|nr:NTP transferase domain-containing protein [Rhizomicrobium sp.]
MIFTFPMAGESRRFATAGYRQPKFRLDIHGAPLFDHVVNGFSAYFDSDVFLFIARNAAAATFARQRCKALGVARSCVITLDHGTSGQAETVFAGLEKADIGDDDAIAVFNVDTIRPGYVKPDHVADPCCAGYLEVFRGTGPGWSYVAPDVREGRTVVMVAEKLAISDLCCTGLYYFRKAGDFRWAYRHPAPPRSQAERQERYVAPLYNALIACGERIVFTEIASSQIVFCGTPQEYEEAAASEEISRRLRL